MIWLWVKPMVPFWGRDGTTHFSLFTGGTIWTLTNLTLAKDDTESDNMVFGARAWPKLGRNLSPSRVVFEGGSIQEAVSKRPGNGYGVDPAE